MKILYFRNDNSPIDIQIGEALGESAEFVDIKEFDIDELVKKANKADVFLFHAQVPVSDQMTMMLIIERLQIILKQITAKKVLWFQDKVWAGKITVVEALLPFVDYAFFMDETWVRRMKEPVYALHPAAPVTPLQGIQREELESDMAYVGQIYGPREQEYEFLKKEFGEGIKFYKDKYGQDLADLCQSAKILLIPSFPFDDFYWSERIYSYLSMGGLVVCRRTHGLKEEGFKNGEHYFEYETEEEFEGLIRSLLEEDDLREAIAKNGQEFVKGHTWKNRLEEMFKVIK